MRLTSAKSPPRLIVLASTKRIRARDVPDNVSAFDRFGGHVTSRDLPTAVKVAIIAGGLLLLRYLTLAVLPEPLTWPAYIFFWIWAYHFWTGAGSLRIHDEPPRPLTKTEVNESRIASIREEFENRGENVGLIKVNDDGSTSVYVDNFPRPYGLSPRWVPYKAGFTYEWKEFEVPEGEFLSRMAYHEQVELEIIVRRSTETNAMDSDIAILERLQDGRLPSNRDRVAEYVDMEIRYIENFWPSADDTRRAFKDEWSADRERELVEKEERKRDLLRELRAFRARL